MPLQDVVTKQVVHSLLACAADVPFAVRYWDGTGERFGDGAPRFTVSLRDPRLTRMLREDLNMALGDAYMRGQIEVEGDLADVVSAAAGALKRRQAGTPDAVLTGYLTNIVTGAARRLGRRSRRRQQEDVAHHYDLSNEFFKLWLDESLTYSCAYFRTPADSLETAQTTKNRPLPPKSARRSRARRCWTSAAAGARW